MLCRLGVVVRELSIEFGAEPRERDRGDGAADLGCRYFRVLRPSEGAAAAPLSTPKDCGAGEPLAPTLRLRTGV